MPEFVTVCEDAAKAAGQQLLSWTDRFQVREKGPADLVTEADLAAEQAACQVIRAAFPHHQIIGEEGTGKGSPSDSEFTWYIDPLDGTTNYVHHVPHYCVSIALAHQGELIAGVVYCPPNRDLYTAAAGGGAFLNGRRLSTSKVTQLSEAMVATSFPPVVDSASGHIQTFERIMAHAQTIRRMGSAALNLCYVAAGRFDLYWAPPSISSWDVAAGVLLVREAGGCVTALDGSEFSIDNPPLISASNAKIHAEMLALVSSK